MLTDNCIHPHTESVYIFTQICKYTYVCMDNLCSMCVYIHITQAHWMDDREIDDRYTVRDRGDL